MAGATYNSFARFAHLPACSFDWGSDGYAGCSNYGGELLYLSAPSPDRGLIMARGDFSTSLYALLSRTQVAFGGPTTFGLEIAKVDQPYDHDHRMGPEENHGAKKKSSFQLGTMIERGCFNYRWPFNEYYLDLHENLSAIEPRTAPEVATQSGVEEHRHVGTCQMLSFAMARNRMSYQVLRIEEGGHTENNSNSCGGFPSKSQVVLTMGGPIWLSSFEQDHNEKTDQVQFSNMLELQ
jgi:hypothetical protein